MEEKTDVLRSELLTMISTTYAGWNLWEQKLCEEIDAKRENLSLTRYSSDRRWIVLLKFRRRHGADKIFVFLAAVESPESISSPSWLLRPYLFCTSQYSFITASTTLTVPMSSKTTPFLLRWSGSAIIWAVKAWIRGRRVARNYFCKSQHETVNFV